MSLVRKILGFSDYQPLNLIEISRDNLLHNLKVLSKINKRVKIAPVLKSNAYGHGLLEIAKTLDSGLRQNDSGGGIPFFCVDSIYEAYELLKAKIKTPILIMGYINPENLKVKKLPFSFAVSTIDVALAVSKFQPQAGVHIFVDTGMNREGVPLSELPQFLSVLPKNLKIEGLMSHLASGELPNDPVTKMQIKNFQKAQEIVKNFGFHPKWIHLSNSGGALNNLNPGCNMARVGIASYGISPAQRGLTPKRGETPLKPVLTLKTKLIQIKTLESGDKVGYNSTFTARRSITLGVLPIGYYDGVDRRLSNKGIVTINGVECPILGRVSMNITTIDIIDYLKCHPGLDPGSPFEILKQVQNDGGVVVFSNNPSDKNSIENAAKLCNTIPYDLLVSLADSTKRVAI